MVGFSFVILFFMVMGCNCNWWYSVISSLNFVVDKGFIKCKISEEWVKNCGVFVIFWDNWVLKLFGLKFIIFNIILVSVVFFMWK